MTWETIATIIINWIFVAILFIVIYKLLKKTMKSWMFEVLKEYEKSQQKINVMNHVEHIRNKYK